MVLFQLGGPDSLDAVEPFLYNLFSDPDIIDFPGARLARPMLARLMAASRAQESSESLCRARRQVAAGRVDAAAGPGAGAEPAAVARRPRGRCDALLAPFTEEAIAALVRGAG